MRKMLQTSQLKEKPPPFLGPETQLTTRFESERKKNQSDETIQNKLILSELYLTSKLMSNFKMFCHVDLMQYEKTNMG